MPGGGQRSQVDHLVADRTPTRAARRRGGTRRRAGWWRGTVEPAGTGGPGGHQIALVLEHAERAQLAERLLDPAAAERAEAVAHRLAVGPGPGPDLLGQQGAVAFGQDLRDLGAVGPVARQGDAGQHVEHAVLVEACPASYVRTAWCSPAVSLKRSRRSSQPTTKCGELGLGRVGRRPSRRRCGTWPRASRTRGPGRARRRKRRGGPRGTRCADRRQVRTPAGPRPAPGRRPRRAPRAVPRCRARRRRSRRQRLAPRRRPRAPPGPRRATPAPLGAGAASRAARRPGPPGRRTRPTAPDQGSSLRASCSRRASAIGALPGGNSAASSTSPARRGSSGPAMPRP